MGAERLLAAASVGEEVDAAVKHYGDPVIGGVLMPLTPKRYQPWGFRRMMHRGRYYEVHGSDPDSGFVAEHLTLVETESGYEHKTYIRSERLHEILIGNVMRHGVEVAEFPGKAPMTFYEDPMAKKPAGQLLLFDVIY